MWWHNHYNLHYKWLHNTSLNESWIRQYLGFTDEGKSQKFLLGQLINHEKKIRIYLSPYNISIDQIIKYWKLPCIMRYMGNLYTFHTILLYT